MDNLDISHLNHGVGFDVGQTILASNISAINEHFSSSSKTNLQFLFNLLKAEEIEPVISTSAFEILDGICFCDFELFG